MSNCVAVIEFMHETNTFSILTTNVEKFHAGHYFVGDEIKTQFKNTNSEIGGFLQAVDKYGWNPVFTIAASAEPGGIVSEETRKEITDKAISQLRKNGPYDGVYIAFHGAMVTETSQDGETQFLMKLREELGNDIPIAVSFDLHANIFDEMSQYVDIAISYRTYPHIDMAEIGKEACDLLERTMQGEIEPSIEIARPPMLAGCDDGRVIKDGVMCQLLSKASTKAKQKGILSVSINAGFTDADVVATGPSVIVCYDELETKDDLPKEIANDICSEIWKLRHIYDLPIPLPKCLEQLKRQNLDNDTIVIADFSDNPGSGAYGDCTAIIKSLLDLNVENAAAGALWDPEAVQEIIHHGVGAVVTITIGGKTDPSVGGGPIKVTGIVTGISEGNFVFEGPMHRGLQGQLGMSACLKVEGLEIVIVSERIQMLDKNIFRALGVESSERSVLVVKSMQHFRAAFEPTAKKVIVTDAGGLCTPNFANRVYTKIRRPVMPLDKGISFN